MHLSRVRSEFSKNNIFIRIRKPYVCDYCEFFLKLLYPVCRNCFLVGILYFLTRFFISCLDDYLVRNIHSNYMLSMYIKLYRSINFILHCTIELFRIFFKVLFYFYFQFASDHSLIVLLLYSRFSLLYFIGLQFNTGISLLLS